MSTPRTTLVHAACDDIAREAISAGRQSLRPTVALIRDRGIRGSQTDIQNDIHSWFLSAFEHHLAAGRISGIPDNLVSAFEAFWSAARQLAADDLATEREAMEAEKIASIDAAADAHERRLAAEARERASAEEAARNISALDNAVTAAERKVSEHEHTLAAQAQRIEAMTAEAAARERDVALRIQALDAQVREATDARAYVMQQLDAERQERKRYEAEAGRARDALAGEQARSGEFQRRAVTVEAEAVRLREAVAANAKAVAERDAALATAAELKGTAAGLQAVIDTLTVANAAGGARIAILEAERDMLNAQLEKATGDPQSDGNGS